MLGISSRLGTLLAPAPSWADVDLTRFLGIALRNQRDFGRQIIVRGLIFLNDEKR